MSGQIGYKDIVTNGLVLYLDAANDKSYVGSGTSWNSLCEDRYIATIFRPTFTSEYNGGIVTNVASSQVTIINPNFNTDFTLTWVIKKTSQQFPVLVGNIFSNGCCMVFGQNSVYITKNGTGFTPVTVVDFGASTATSLNTTYVITISLNKSINTFYCYINGSLISSGVYNSTTFNTTGNYLLRADSTSSYLLGTLYLYMHYNVKLTDAEILQNYNSTKARFGL